VEVGIGVALIAGAMMGWGVAVASYMRLKDAPVTGQDELSAAYSRGCGDCRCQQVRA
jgi:purine-cytosine permease-like protein